MKAWRLFVGLGVFAYVGLAGAAELSEELRLRVQREIERVEEDGPRMSYIMAAMREAGASYVPELTAPVRVEHYQDLEARRIMTGVYLMDLTYASTFYHNHDAARYGQAIARLLEDLGFPHPSLERDYREALERIDEPGGDERFQALQKKLEADEAWQEMLKTEDGCDLVVDGLYGFLIEALYLAAELTVLSDYDLMFMQYINDMRESFVIYKSVLMQFDQNPELSAIVEKDERIELIHKLLHVLGDLPEIGRSEIERLRPIVVRARAEAIR